MGLFNKFINRLFFKYVDIDRLKVVQANNKIESLCELVEMGESSRFYEEAKVYNFRNNKTFVSIGEGTHIKGELLTFANGGSINIGSNTYIGEGSRIWSADKIVIGDNVLISHNCNIIDTDSHEVDHIVRAKSFGLMIKNGHSKEKSNVLTAPIFIDDYAWLSYNVSILKGVRIGKGAVVGAGSVVTKDVPEFTVVAGNPAVIIKKIK